MFSERGFGSDLAGLETISEYSIGLDRAGVTDASANVIKLVDPHQFANRCLTLATGNTAGCQLVSRR